MKLKHMFVFAIAAVVTGAVLPATTASANDDTVLSCVEEGHPRITPGLTMNPQSFTFDENGTLGPCVGPGGKNLTGKYIVAGGRGEGTCAAIQFSGPVTISWSDGTSTAVQVTGRTLGTFVLSEGKTLSGRFAGGAYHFLAMLLTTDPMACGSAGLREGDLHGSMIFTSGSG